MEAASFGTFSHNFFDLLQSFFKCGSSVRYITFLTRRWCKALKRGGTVSLKKRGSRRLPHYPSLISIPELAICLISKAHVTKMKLNLNFLPIRASNSADKLLYFLEARDLYKFNYVQC